MAKTLSDPPSESLLSDHLEELASVTETAIGNNAVSGSKRRGSTIFQTTKRVRQAAAQDVNSEDAFAGAVTDRIEKRPTRKTTVEQRAVRHEVKLGSNGIDKGTIMKRVTRKTEHQDKSGGDESKAKKTEKRKTKSVKHSEPLAERSKDIKHRIGAHVSSAGGKLYLCTSDCERRKKN